MPLHGMGGDLRYTRHLANSGQPSLPERKLGHHRLLSRLPQQGRILLLERGSVTSTHNTNIPNLQTKQK
uniref:Uncharacterized protein n=1 Tax=Vitis vinifera TaxID=29760 RepID=F6H5Z6_VITVI